ncbi:amidohydrolase family protein [Streptacidiphilus sp. PB12-B1b]|uniref:amidohydrolase family protein n=1 Tax=Streptacidiphilus sp. PB12-B1b TaxID=2705012 RepID=UPI001CDBB4BD|nr:amidohydrolase family protein [Streptacidiphilus sp. PB12-B1b]QMU76923.1 amidohydrolase family protein [Streptacidiphilus sp. PB12-B1b]
MTAEEVCPVVLQVRGVVLPEREERSFWIDGDRLRTDPVPHADLVVDGGWLLPGLVDVHTHPGTEGIEDPFSDEVLRRHLVDHRDAGVLLVRTPGSAARMPGWVDEDPDMPRVRSAGRWLATPGRFFPGFGRDVSEADLVHAAVEEAKASSGWCKVIGDWKHSEPALPLEILTAVVQAVHMAGGRVAAHCQTAEGSRNAVLAGVDSLEHGMHLDPDLIGRMAAQGTAFVPTLSVFGATADQRRAGAPSSTRDWWLAGWEGMLPNVSAAHEAGVTVLAGTDSFPCGTVTSEIEWLVHAGLPAEAALGAASWSARSWLGLPGLVDGAPADLVAYDTDPTIDTSVLAHPTRIILRGRVVS